MSKLLKKLHRRLVANGQRRAQKRRLRLTIMEGRSVDFAFYITGGAGDVIVTARFVRDFIANIGESTFDVYYASPEIASLVFKPVAGFSKAYPGFLFRMAKSFYSYSMCLNQFIFTEKVPTPIKGFLRNPSRCVAVEKVLNRVWNRTKPIERLKDNHPYLDGALGVYAKFKGCARRDFLQYLAGIPYGGDELQIDRAPDALERFGLTPGGFVSVHNGYDDDMAMPGRRSTKAYPHWGRVVATLKSRGVRLPFVQIGSPLTSEPIAEVDVNLIGKTKFAEAISIVGGSVLHLDNEGGFVHVAAAVGRRSAVAFGPTSADYFAYPGNLNFRPRECGGCWWSEPTWMKVCPRGLAMPVCMESHDSEAIAAAIFAALASPVESLPNGEQRIEAGSLSPLAAPAVEAAIDGRIWP